MNYLFICKHNLARSAMAEAFFRHYYPKHSAKSAGVKTISQGDTLPMDVWSALQEKGIDFKNHRTMQLSERLVDEADKIITLCEEDLCPQYLLNSKKNEFWPVRDPVNGYNSIIYAREVIEQKIKELGLK